MRYMKKTAVALLVTCSLAAATSAYAFSDIKDTRQEKIAAELQNKGIIQGVSADRFAPADKLTAAQGVQILVKAMDFKAVNGKSEADNIPPDAWYAKAAVIAQDNGLPVGSIKDWNAKLTREQFALLLYKAVTATAGTYPSVQMLMPVADGDQIQPETKTAVQFLLLSGIAGLDGQNRFYPKQNMTRMEAAEMTYDALQYIQKHNGQQDPGESEDEVSVQMEKIDDQVNKIVISKSGMPNPGYGISVDRIDFLSGQKAVAYYHFTTPEPGKMYPQVISTAKASFYLDSKYKVSVKRTPGENGPPISIPGIDKTLLK
ncbi:hypothetical protein J23TS9_24080 [Paenibacillus sp. J23TS9]|uniref:protease complex subunit PrcB family protein n=1 Tax=Paenibacillus sp. J23TS9 TaxID=2807193 RepID=UPI001B1C4B0F|nr:protease complex subunit PrcB family protein [Paenibacillus sp. J23TS9]GIP27278.1 hypothetical protein J23TS9_24080 [Paenibacillus sp. J23TS9]